MTQKNSPLVLATQPINKLLLSYALPSIIAMTASSLYNIIDSIFIGHGVGALAISGLAITFPLMNLAAAFGSLVGVGASTLISVKLGQNDYDEANRILGNVFILNLIIGISFTVVSLYFLDPLLYFFGASENTIPYARDFMHIILLGNVVSHSYFGLNAALRSVGFPKLAMYTTLLSVVINCILNPLFIFGLGWGIKGSAIATVISQVVSLSVQIIHFSNPKQLIHFKKGIYRLRSNIVNGILSIGLSPFLMNLCACMVVLLINRGLFTHGGDLAVGGYGIVNRVLFLFVMIIMGLNQGMQPIAGYNYGARLYPRVTAVTKLTTYWASSVSVLGFIICQLFPHTIAGFFTSDAELINSAVYGMRIAFFFFPIVGFQMVSTNFFLSIGMANKAIFLSLTRQLIFLIPFLIILPRFYGVLGVWASLPAADGISTIVTAIVLFRQFATFRKHNAQEIKNNY